MSKALPVILSFILVLSGSVLVSAAVGLTPQQEKSQDFIIADRNFVQIDYIAIDGDDDLRSQADSRNWDGSGTEDDPYIIEGYNITNRRHLLRVVNTTYHFIFQDSWLNGIDTTWCGLYLCMVSNAVVRNVTVTNAAIGMHMSKLNDSVIEDCTVYDCSNQGIVLEWTCARNQIRNNTIYRNEKEGILLDWFNHENLVIGNRIFENYFYGIYALEDSYTNTIVENEIFETHGSGIILSGNRTFVSNNFIYHNSASGIIIKAGQNNVSNNLIWANKRMGIWGTYLASENAFFNNTILNCSSHAVRLDSYTKDNSVHHNDLINNAETSQCLDHGSENTFEWNYYNPWNHTDLDRNSAVDFIYPIEGDADNNDISPSIIPNTEIPAWYEFSENEPVEAIGLVTLTIPAITVGLSVIVIAILFVSWRNKPRL